jgi:hypothetical protein
MPEAGEQPGYDPIEWGPAAVASRRSQVAQGRNIRQLTGAAAVVAALAWLPLAGAAVASPAASHAQSQWRNPRISIVWPHDARGNQTAVVGSALVNASVWPSEPVVCDQPPQIPLSLWRAKDNAPAEPIGAAPRMILRSGDGFRFPTLEFDDVPADLVAEPAARYRFVAFAPNTAFTANVWVHAADPRTFFPQPVVPTGYADLRPGQVDTRIQVVWPHDDHGKFAPVEAATRVNVAVDIFEHGTLRSVPTGFPPPDLRADVFLSVAEGNSPQSLTMPGSNERWARAQQTTYVVGDKTFPRWVFNDVPVKPGAQYHFLAWTGGASQVFPTIWTHAVDARTFLPTPQPPDYGGRAAEFHCG